MSTARAWQEGYRSLEASMHAATGLESWGLGLVRLGLGFRFLEFGLIGPETVVRRAPYTLNPLNPTCRTHSHNMFFSVSRLLRRPNLLDFPIFLYSSSLHCSSFTYYGIQITVLQRRL